MKKTRRNSSATLHWRLRTRVDRTSIKNPGPNDVYVVPVSISPNQSIGDLTRSRSDWCRRPDANPHANRSNPNLKMAMQAMSN